MRVGPFKTFDFSAIEEYLDDKKILFDVFVDKESEAKILAEHNNQASASPQTAAGGLNLNIIYIDIDDGDFEKTKQFFEKYGILPISDGSYELGED